MINSSLDAFNKVVQAVERKKGKLQELLLTEESYLENLEAVERILLEAKNSRKDDSMPKQLRYITYRNRTHTYLNSTNIFHPGKENSSCSGMLRELFYFTGWFSRLALGRQTVRQKR